MTSRLQFSHKYALVDEDEYARLNKAASKGVANPKPDPLLSLGPVSDANKTARAMRANINNPFADEGQKAVAHTQLMRAYLNDLARLGPPKREREMVDERGFDGWARPYGQQFESSREYYDDDEQKYAGRDVRPKPYIKRGAPYEGADLLQDVSRRHESTSPPRQTQTDRAGRRRSRHTGSAHRPPSMYERAKKHTRQRAEDRQKEESDVWERLYDNRQDVRKRATKKSKKR